MHNPFTFDDGYDRYWYGGWVRPLAKLVCCVHGHNWRQTIVGFVSGTTYYGRQCMRCWKAEECPCLSCVKQRKKEEERW